MRLKRIIVLFQFSFVTLIAIFGLSSCFKDEQPAEPIEAEIVEIETDLLNRAQVYYNLNTKQVVGFNGVNDWDLAFDCRPDSFYILLNSARGMGVFNTRESKFSKVYWPWGYRWKYDDPGGDPSKSAVGVWGDFNFSNPQSFENVYILHLGYDESGRPLGLRKFKIHGFSDNHYFVQFADLNNENNHTVFVPKKPEYNYSYITLQGNGSVVQVAPPKRTWDLCITPYHDTLHSKSPFSIDVTFSTGISEGILTNRSTTKSAAVSGLSFSELNYFNMADIPLNSKINTIGNRWRYWDLGTSSFKISDQSVYVVTDLNNRFYALEFLQYRKFSSTSGSLRFRLKNL